MQCSLRNAVGSSAARKLRVAAQIPGVVYGMNEEPRAITVAERDLIRILHAHHGRVGLLDLLIEGETAQPLPAVLKELQRHPVTRKILSVDFQRVSLTEKIRAQVAVNTIGTASGVKSGGILELLLHEVEIECLPTDLPEAVTVEVSALEIGDALPASALVLPPTVTLLTPPDEPLVTVVPPKVEAEEVPAAPAAEVAEPEVIGRGAEAEEEEAE